MKRMPKNKIFSLLVALCMLVVFGAGAVLADSDTITVTWIVPGETGFLIDLAGSETEIVFNTGDRNFSKVPMRSQTDATPGFNLTNQGNQAVDVHFAFNDEDWPSGTSFFNVSVDANDNSTLYWWESSNETNNQTIKSSLGIGSTVSCWIWSSGIDVAESAEGEDLETLVVTTVGV